jgi:HAD superfamily hydrolase (TIGR01509 family)
MLDCDGVLFDSRQANVLFYNDLLRRFGRPPMSPDDVDYVHVHTAEQSVAYLFRGDPLAQAAEGLRPSLDYTPYIGHMLPEPTLREALECLRGRCRLAVCTNRTNTIGAVLAQHGLAGYFDLVVSALDVARPKPAPDQLVRALTAFGCPSAAALYVGDAAVDMEAARAAAVPFVAYRNRALEAAHHIERLIQLTDLVSATLATTASAG